MTVMEVVTKAVARSLAVDEDTVEPGAKIVSDLGADSLEMLEITLTVEDHYEIDIDRADADRLFAADCTVQQLAEYVQTRIA